MKKKNIRQEYELLSFHRLSSIKQHCTNLYLKVLAKIHLKSIPPPLLKVDINGDTYWLEQILGTIQNVLNRYKFNHERCVVYGLDDYFVHLMTVVFGKKGYILAVNSSDMTSDFMLINDPCTLLLCAVSFPGVDDHGFS